MPEHSSHSANQPTPMTVSLNSPTPPQLETRKQLSVCMDLPVLDISYKWNHSVRGLLVWLFFLSMMFSRITCVLAWSVQRSVTFMLPLRWTYSFPWVNNIPSYGYTTIFIHLYTHYSHFWLPWIHCYELSCIWFCKDKRLPISWIYTSGGPYTS